MHRAYRKKYNRTMKINFTKYHGAGNDFLIFYEEEISGVDKADLARKACCRTTGVGADGILICSRDPLSMEIINCDGSHASMCGNGIRCFTSYCIDEGIVSTDAFSIQTDAGEMVANVIGRDPFSCEINMGKPDWSPSVAGVDFDGKEAFIDKKIDLPDGKTIIASCLFMGTSHTVVWIDAENNVDVPDIQNEEELEAFGRMLHALPIFPKYTNVNMAVISDKDEITVRTYERGAGMTAACGTGACATVVVANKQGKTGNDVRVKLLIDSVKVRIESDETVFMAGPAVRIASGVYSYT